MRKHHRPRRFALIDRLELPQDQQRDIGIAYRISLQTMVSGHGTEQAWGTVCVSLNIALILAERGFCPGAIETIKRAQEAMLRSQERAGRTGRWAFDGEGLRAVQDAFSAHDEQMAKAPRADITAALREVHRRIETGEVFAPEERMAA